MSESPPDPAPPPVHGRLRWAWWLLAWGALALGVIGIVVPGLPTVPFILLSAFAAARGSRRLHARLLADPRSGPMIRDWQAHGAVGRRAKWLATLMMGASGVVLLALARPLVAAVAIACMAAVATWLWLRPERATARQDPQSGEADAEALRARSMQRTRR